MVLKLKQGNKRLHLKLPPHLKGFLNLQEDEDAYVNSAIGDYLRKRTSAFALISHINRFISKPLVVPNVKNEGFTISRENYYGLLMVCYEVNRKEDEVALAVLQGNMSYYFVDKDKEEL